MNIQLKGWKIKNMSFKIDDKPSKKRKKKEMFNLSIGHSFPEDNNREFGIGFIVNIKDEDFKIVLEMLFIFQVDQMIDESFKQSDFVKINAPAIAFPYVRSFISNLTLQAGFEPIILPSVNFVKLLGSN
ncbi:MAG: protein-export chaperone SecB [Bacteroidales bacterium]|nr:protein-export chaperone SecB [Bacteroidales bacterium]